MRPKFISFFFILILVFCILPCGLKAQDEKSKKDSALQHQKDLVGLAIDIFNIKQKNVDSIRLTKKVNFSLLPGPASVSGGGAAIVTAFTATFYTGDPVKTSLSNVLFSPWFSLNGKFVLPFRNLVWFPDNLFLWKGDSRIMIYPQYTWGLGGQNNKDEKILIEYNYLRLYHSLLKKVKKLFFLGAGYNYDFHYNIHYPDDSVLHSSLPGFGHLKENGKESISSGPVLNFLVDTRDNAINPSRGTYFAIDYRLNYESLGSTANWNSFLVDTRKYIPFDRNRQNLLAFWAYYWAVTKGDAPYLDLPSIGWDNYNGSGRGFQQNRYRSNKLVYFETEYRKDISANGLLGFVVFANIHAVSEFSSDKFIYWHPAAGTGLRLKFNKISNTNVALDFGASKDYFGVYFTMGEVF